MYTILEILHLFHPSWSLNVTGSWIKEGNVILKFSTLVPLSLDFVKPKLRLADKGSLSPSELFPLDVIYSPFKRKYLLSNDLPSPALNLLLSGHLFFPKSKCQYNSKEIVLMRWNLSDDCLDLGNHFLHGGDSFLKNVTKHKHTQTHFRHQDIKLQCFGRPRFTEIIYRTMYTIYSQPFLEYHQNNIIYLG